MTISERHITFRRIESLPRLAWCAQVLRGDSGVLVEHGPWVETWPSAFVEGAWNGPFGCHNFADAAVVLGSGGGVTHDGIAFTTTSHTMERLHSVRINEALFVSNSFSYLLAATGDGLDHSRRLYERDFLTFLNGYHRARRSVRTARGRTVRLHYNETFHVDRDLSIRAEKPPLPPVFTEFVHYTTYLREVIQALHANATASDRQIMYAPLATISSGYDSVACAVLAKSIGCTQAVTFPSARRQYNDPPQTDFDDSGAMIGQYLGMRVSVFARDAYLHRTDFPEAEFLATGNGGDDVVMSALESVLPKALLFTGFLGDTLWGTAGQDPQESRRYIYRFPAGGSLTEFRLRVGFIHAPVPLFTFTRHPELYAITRSREMEPWRLGGHYDRPIPRRIVESCGVPREIYAQQKKAITQPFWITPAVEQFMSKHSYEDLLAFHSRLSLPWHRRLMTELRTFRVRVIRRLRTTPILWRLYRLTWISTMSFANISRLSLIGFTLLTSVSGVKFHWAVAKLVKRYRASQFKASPESSSVATRLPAERRE